MSPRSRLAAYAIVLALAAGGGAAIGAAVGPEGDDDAPTVDHQRHDGRAPMPGGDG